MVERVEVIISEDAKRLEGLEAERRWGWHVDPVAAERDDQRLVPDGRESRQVGLGEPPARGLGRAHQALTDFAPIERVRPIGGDGPIGLGQIW